MDLMNNLFGPLDSKYCALFYFLAILAFINIVLVLFITPVMIYNEPKKVKTIVSILFLLLLSLIPYFMYRLFFSMCTNSLN